MWLVYFVLLAVLAMLEKTVLFPLVWLCDLISCCLFPTIKMMICGWLYSKEYRGALLVEQLASKYLDLAFDKLQPVGNVFAFVGVPKRTEEKHDDKKQE